MNGLKLLSLVFLILVFSCKKDQMVGLNATAPGESLPVTQSDSIGVNTLVRASDPSNSSGKEINFIGSFWDPEFGNTSANVFFDFEKTSSNICISRPYLIDSVILSLPYSGFSGDTTSIQEFKVFELTKDLGNENKSDISETEYINASAPVGTISFFPKPTKKIIEGSNTLAPQVRIPLSIGFGSNMMNICKTSFKGFYIQTTSNHGPGNKGGMFYFDLKKAVITVFFKKPDDIYNGSVKIDFSANKKSINQYKHNFSTGAATGNLNKSNTDFIYFQGLSGIQSNISFPYLKNLRSNKGIAVNKAELVLKADPDKNSGYQPVEKLLISKLNTDGSVTSDSLLDLVDLGGRYNSSKMEYRFVITNYIQNYLNGNDDGGLTIYPAFTAGTDKRSVVKSGKEIKLVLTLTQLN